ILDAIEPVRPFDAETRARDRSCHEVILAHAWGSQPEPRNQVHRLRVFEHNDRDLSVTRGLSLVLGELRECSLVRFPDVCAFTASRNAGTSPVTAVAELDLHVRVGYDVVVPVGVPRVAAVGGEDRDSLVAEALVGKRVDPLLAGLGSPAVEQKEIHPFKCSAHVSLVRPDLLDNRTVPLVDAHPPVVATADPAQTPTGAPPLPDRVP